MNRGHCARCILVSLLLLATVIWVAGAASLDVRFSDWLYDDAIGRWPVAHSGWLRAVAYDGAKYALGATALGLLGGILYPSWLRRLRLARAEAAYLLMCLIAVPVIVAAIKYSSGVACAAELTRYGGAYPDDAGHFGPAALAGTYAARGCWPSGHASGGYALLALGFLDRPPPVRFRLWAAGALLGTLMGAYQIARGAHFVSHVAVTALMAQCLVCGIAFAMSARLYRAQ
ncbi:MAG: phosphatase PAP2 family protein [Gammaproteobacteria bacterium]